MTYGLKLIWRDEVRASNMVCTTSISLASHSGYGTSSPSELSRSLRPSPCRADISHSYDYAATKTGSIIIPCSGFDSIPSDVSAYLANKTLKAVVGLDTAIDNSTSAWDVRGAVSGGTLGTAAASMEEVPKAKLEASMKDYSLSPGECPLNLER